MIAREVVEPGTPGLAAVVEAFGAGMSRPDGSLDRPALAAVVFADPAARARLDAIVHPLVRARAAEVASGAAPDAVVVHDVPLLAETGQAAVYDLVLVVEAHPETRVARLVQRGLTAEDARARMAAQATTSSAARSPTSSWTTAAPRTSWRRRSTASGPSASPLRRAEAERLDRESPRSVTWGSAVVGDTGIEPVTSSVSGKRATAAPIALLRPDGRTLLRARAPRSRGGDGI